MKSIKLSDWLILIPLSIIVGVIPLIVFLEVIPIPNEYAKYWHKDYVFDYYSFYKSRALFFCSILLIIASFIISRETKFFLKKDILLVLLIFYGIMILVNTYISETPYISLWGFFGRSEGMFVLLGYVLITISIYSYINKESHFLIILSSVFFSILVISLFGFLQLIDLDFFSTQIGKNLILPKENEPYAYKISFAKAPYVFSTLYNSNNISFLMAMIFPLASAFFILSKSKIIVITSVFLIIASYAMLIAANGRGGWISASISLVILYLLPINNIVKSKSRILILIFIMLAGFATINTLGGNRPINRLSSLLEESEKLTNLSPVISKKCPDIEDEKIKYIVNKYGSMGSGRVYIWTRSWKLIKKTIFFGYGPDTFALYFPNKDCHYFNKNFVDKPHNMHIQTIVNIGGVSFLIFLLIIVIHSIKTIKTLKESKNNKILTISSALYVGCIGYLLAGFFYDSTINVAPYFWTILGLNMVINNFHLYDQKDLAEFK